MTLTVYCPEMGERKPQAQIEANRSYNGKHYYLYTHLELKPGRGIEYLKTYEAKDLVSGSHRVGMRQYRVTRKAFEQICEKYTVSYESLLD